jgi:hypothetical protein
MTSTAIILMGTIGACTYKITAAAFSFVIVPVFAILTMISRYGA